MEAIAYDQFVGKWTGELITIDKKDAELNRHVTQIKIEKNGTTWAERRTVADTSGAVSSQHVFTISEFVRGRAVVECDDDIFQGCEAVLTQCGPGTTTLTLSRAGTGVPFLVETCTMVSDTHRIRTLQNFSREGDFVSVSVVEESRV